MRVHFKYQQHGHFEVLCAWQHCRTRRHAPWIWQKYPWARIADRTLLQKYVQNVFCEWTRRLCFGCVGSHIGSHTSVFYRFHTELNWAHLNTAACTCRQAIGVNKHRSTLNRIGSHVKSPIDRNNSAGMHTQGQDLPPIVKPIAKWVPCKSTNVS